MKNTNEKKGLVFNIQRFSIHDGPGIRTTIFMKGCPLRCNWCSNPESQDYFPNLMVRDINCRLCGACVETCPRGAIVIENKCRKIDRAKCDQCIKCVKACHYGSLVASGEYIGLHDLLDEVRRDKAFYVNSGGGVTISGGEPLFQGKVIMELLAMCKREKLHTVLDTTGYAPWNMMERVIEHVDLILFDIKHLDSNKHKKATGVDNNLILENFTHASEHKKLWVRIPVIAGFNDSIEHVREIARLCKAKRVEKISLLPYHEGGKLKCEQLGRSYHKAAWTPPDDGHIARLKDAIESEGTKVSVGS